MMKQKSLSTGDLKSSLRTGEQQTKVVNQNINRIEQHYPTIVRDMAHYVVRTAKLRDVGDVLHTSLRQYANEETPALRGGLTAFSECFAAVQDHRNSLVTRLEGKVLQPFTIYETKCKQARMDLRKHTLAHTKELQEHKALERVRARATDGSYQVKNAETKFQNAAEEANMSTQILTEQVSKFERQKIQDIKKVFGDFMLSEMMFYAKAIEIYTKGYQELMSIDEDEGINSLQNSLKWEPHNFQPELRNDPSHGSAPTLMQSGSTSNYYGQGQMFNETM